MTRLKKPIFSIFGMALLAIGFVACSSDDVQEENMNTSHYSIKGSETKEFDSFFYQRNEIALKNFSVALLKSMAESIELRDLVKNEALKKFNNDTEVLISQLSELSLEKGTVASKINEHLEGTTIEDILDIVPSLTILVPELPEESFSAEKWNTFSQLPMVAIRTSLSNDNPVVNWSEGNIETGVIPSDIIPGYPILVTKTNERVITSSNNNYGKIATREFHTSKLTGVSYRFTDAVFDGTLFPIKNKPVPSNVDTQLAEAYNLTINSDAWQRDHIYYDINPSTPNGPFNYKFKEYIGFIAPREYNGSAQASYDAFADQADPRYNPRKDKDNWNDWTDGSYELEFHFLLNDSGDNGGQTIPKSIPVSPTDLFKLEYDKHVNSSWIFWKKTHYTIRSVKAKKYWADLEAFSWNLENFAASVKVEVFEKDPDTEETITINSSAKAATNFGIDVGADLFDIVKLGIKFGTSNEKNTSHSHQIKTTYSSDRLGSSLIDFGEPVVTGKYPINVFFAIDIYSLNSYSTGTIDFSLVPKRVQQ